MLQSAPVEIFYAGRRPAEEAAECFRKAFAQRKEVAKQPLETLVIRKAEAVREISEALDVTQGKLVMGLRTCITLEDEDYPALLMLNTVLGAGMTCKLFMNVREKLSLCYYVSSSIEKYKGVMLISSGVDFENYEKAKNAILTELEACKKGEITEEELESARLQILSSLRSFLDSPAQMDDFYCGMAIAGGMDIPEIMDAVEKLTAEDVAAAAQKLSMDTIYFLKGEEA